MTVRAPFRVFSFRKSELKEGSFGVRACVAKGACVAEGATEKGVCRGAPERQSSLPWMPGIGHRSETITSLFGTFLCLCKRQQSKQSRLAWWQSVSQGAGVVGPKPACHPHADTIHGSEPRQGRFLPFLPWKRFPLHLPSRSLSEARDTPESTWGLE